MRIWGELQKACLELLGTDPAQGVIGRVWFNTASKEMKIDDGTSIQTVLSGVRGGGSTLDWTQNGNGAFDGFDSVSNRVFGFSATQLQQLFAGVKVPASYSPGRQIKLVVDVYSAEAGASKVLLASLATLVRAGTDLYDSITNQHDSVTLASSLSGATTNIPFKIELDLTDATGQINGVAVQPNDFLRLKLFRQNSATAPQSEVFTDSTADLFALASMEISF